MERAFQFLKEKNEEKKFESLFYIEKLTNFIRFNFDQNQQQREKNQNQKKAITIGIS